MFCTARFYLDDKDYFILKCQVDLPQYPLNKSGMAIGNAQAPQIHIALESTSETHLLHWINNQQIKEHVQVRFINHHRLGADKVFDLYDVTCIRNEEHFWGEGSRPMTNTITLVPAILFYNGAGPIILPWHIQDPNNLNSDTEVTERTVDGTLTDCHFEDAEGNVITNVKRNQDVYIVVNTINMIGELIYVDLSDDDVDYEYNGQYLENDLIEDISVTADTMRIPLKTIKQRD